MDLVKCWVIFMTLFWGVAQLWADVAINSTLDKDVLYMDQTLLYSVIIVTEGEQIDQPIIPIFKGFSSCRIVDTSHVSIINGVKTHRYDIVYRLTPEVPGVYPISPTVVIVEGERYLSPRLSIEVKEGYNPNPQTSVPGTSKRLLPDRKGDFDHYERKVDLAFIELDVDKTECYINEQITMIFRFYRRVPILGNVDYDSPKLEGFWKEDIIPHKMTYEDREGFRYHVTHIRAALFPVRTGNLEIGPAVLRCRLADHSRHERRRLDLDNFFDSLRRFHQGQDVRLSTKPIKINVKLLPEEGQPKDFSGAVGAFRIKAHLDNTDIVIGDAVNLKVGVGGKGWIKGIPMPELPQMNGLQTYATEPKFKSLKKLDLSVVSRNDYEITIVPQEEGEWTVPPLSFTFFNPKKEQYVTVKTKPLTLQIKPSANPVVSQAVIDYSQESEDNVRGIPLVQQDSLRYLQTNLGVSARPWALLNLWFCLGMTLLGPLLYVFVPWLKQRSHLKAGQYLQKQSCSVLKQVKKSLKNLSKQTENTEAYYAGLNGVVRKYLSARLSCAEQGLTGADAKRLLQERQVSQELIQELVDVMNQADHARFGGANLIETMQCDLLKVEQILNRIEKVLKS